MKKLLLIGCLLSFSQFGHGEEPKELPPLDPSYKGVHPMVLVNKGSRIYAVNMTKYTKPHDVQVVYKVDTPDVAFLNLIRGSDLVTIKPKPFNIQRLVRGEEVTVTTDVYVGHFDRGGEVFYSDRSLVLGEKLYARELKDLPDSSQIQEYDYIELSGQERIYVHKIQKSPSFNHLIHIDMSGACMNRFRTSKSVPPESELTYKFVNCGSLKPLYYEVEDFQ